jgi:preprotein translocase subunit SecE
LWVQFLPGLPVNAVCKGGVLTVNRRKSVAENIFLRMGHGISRMFQETIGELRKVSWPSRPEARSMTILVIVVILAMAIFLGVLDLVYTQVFKLILGG